MNSSLKGKLVLVTGADGFIGSHLVERLLEEGAWVRAFCLYNSNGTVGWLEDLEWDKREELDIRPGDIRDARFVREVMEDVEVVFHLAALISIPYSYRAPMSFVETNVIGTVNVLEAVRDSEAKRLINTSTSEVYGTPNTLPITEDHPLQAQSPYSASKIGADKMCEAYALSFGVPVVTLRPFNTYGPRQSARAVIPTILGQLLAGSEEVKLGSLQPRRDFTFVTDTVDGFVRLATADLPPGTTIQLGTGETVSIGDLFNLCCEIAGVRASVIVDEERVRPEQSEVLALQSDPSRARALLRWEPRVSFRDGLEQTLSWMVGRVEARKATEYSI